MSLSGRPDDPASLPLILYRKRGYEPPEAASCWYCGARYPLGSGRHWCDGCHEEHGVPFLQRLRGALARDGDGRGLEVLAPGVLN